MHSKPWAYVITADAGLFCRPFFQGPFIGFWRAWYWSHKYVIDNPSGECTIYPADVAFKRGEIDVEPF